MSTESGRPVVIASNRGPLSYRLVDGAPVGRRGGGGLVSGLAPLVEEGRATWIAAALSDADRAAVRAGVTSADGLSALLLDLDPEDHRLAYDVISNETLWFLHHGLYDLTRSPAYDDAWWHAWEAYRRVNHRFAEAVVDHAPTDAVVLVQDYHLTLLAPVVRAARPDLSLVHFHHTPFAGPDTLRVMPPAARDEMLASLAAHDACGFHTTQWASNFRDVLSHWPPAAPRATVFAASLSSDAAALRETATSSECDTALDEIERLCDGRRLIVRVDRMELSKNIVRGFDAYDLLLEQRPDLRGRVSFLACCYPSRENVEAYARYRDEVVAAAARVNERWGDAGWQPVRLETDDDYPRSVAALRRYDVLVVNPVRDGLNLVAKEGPMVNERDGQLVLSTEAGAHVELAGAADAVHPFDLTATAAAMAAALDRDDGERRDRAVALAEMAGARTPADWLADQLAAAGPGAGTS
jgi:trehalose 6-phosphate synthase